MIVNDRQPIVTIRNILLLNLLGLIPDSERAAEIALHYWYSAFVPMASNLQMQMIMTDFIEKLGRNLAFSSPLGSRSTISGVLQPNIIRELIAMLQSQYQVGDAANELNRVWYA